MNQLVKLFNVVAFTCRQSFVWNQSFLPVMFNEQSFLWIEAEVVIVEDGQVVFKALDYIALF